jgi:hypothetical protein
MARYETIDTSPRFLAVDLEAQLPPGTLEHALNHLLDHEIDLSGFDARFNNDDTGASAYPPGILLKVVRLAYSRGAGSSRAIERACREHVTFIALSGATSWGLTIELGWARLESGIRLHSRCAGRTTWSRPDRRQTRR